MNNINKLNQMIQYLKRLQQKRKILYFFLRIKKHINNYETNFKDTVVLWSQRTLLGQKERNIGDALLEPSTTVLITGLSSSEKLALASTNASNQSALIIALGLSLMIIFATLPSCYMINSITLLIKDKVLELKDESMTRSSTSNHFISLSEKLSTSRGTMEFSIAQNSTITR